ncbi:hypothetical protein [Streptomyces tanashiensis]|uniref:Uncharacterized protein n=1 Tax=Streptomyces tanashiensis TaxID=67367 RepID=A0ABY6R7L9_9ACTN|nr:hypothetical protein [Streptomyces tanashiensis]UZX26075.1 hypothetical protein LDH80_37715 [Streptomyces tanashiensis]GGY34876.1 hypothetical protein GCM10010299_46780 [Streptomyces tanashiensis]
MRKKDSNADGHGQRAVAIRWIQVVPFGAVVLLFGFRIGEREHSGGSSSIAFGLMATSAMPIGILERYRANTAKRSR